MIHLLIVRLKQKGRIQQIELLSLLAEKVNQQSCHRLTLPPERGPGRIPQQLRAQTQVGDFAKAFVHADVLPAGTARAPVGAAAGLLRRKGGHTVKRKHAVPIEPAYLLCCRVTPGWLPAVTRGDPGELLAD
ncbi:MAG TPA: hypothetical protein VL793_03110 [Patescibacteria group bacterium]|nr:hypothetical protein [Patescibacteria group bacterium]